MNRYTVNALIGEGSFGRVYKATRKDDNQTVAIKIISKRGRSSRELKCLRRECDIQARLKHPNVIEMLESFETRNEMVVVTEFALIDLHRYMLRNGVLNEELAQRLTCHLVSALYYLHCNRILHRDLKPQNVLLDEDMHAKLCDFGLARNMTMGTQVLTSIKGTPLYMAPELLAEQPYDHHADLWSLGCICYEALVGHPPHCTTSILQLIKMLRYDEIKWPSFLSSDCRSFLQGLLEKDTSLRTSWTQILCHPFVEGKLYINAGVKADSSPFINPQLNKLKSRAKLESSGQSLDFSKITRKLKALELNQSTDDNLTTSRDSISAIPPSDIETLETDYEDPLNNLTVPFTEPHDLPAKNRNSLTEEISSSNQISNSIKDKSHISLSYQTQDISINTNPGNIKYNGEFVIRRSVLEHLNSNENNLIGKMHNKGLQKRKLSQNLDNFSVRLGHNVENDLHQQLTEQQQQQQQQQQNLTKSKPTASVSPAAKEDSKQCVEKSPTETLSVPDCNQTQSTPIQNDEWMAFLYRSMQEILNGVLDTLQQPNLVSIVVALLRNSTATAEVVNGVSQLLALPFALDNCRPEDLETIKSVYVDIKLVPNLMYASKLLMYRPVSDSNSKDNKLPESATELKLRSLKELDENQSKCSAQLYELICYLVHSRQQFLLQFCDAVAILLADNLIINFFVQDFTELNCVRIANCILAILGCVLRELPENSELVEKIVFSSKVDLTQMLQHKNDLMRLRTCMLIRLLGRISVDALQNAWNMDIKKAIETLAEDKTPEVKQEAENTLEDLCKFSFYT